MWIDIIRLVIRGELIERIRRELEKVIGLIEEEKGEWEKLIDKVDIVREEVREKEVELGILLWGRRRGREKGRRKRERRRRRKEKIILEKIGKIRGLKKGKGRKVLKDIWEIRNFCI